jgi:hypothetical protein
VIDKFTVDVLDPPPGWNDANILVRRFSISEDKVGHVSLVLLQLAKKLWIQHGRVGSEPVVTVRSASSLS